MYIQKVRHNHCLCFDVIRHMLYYSLRINGYLSFMVLFDM